MAITKKSTATKATRPELAPEAAPVTQSALPPEPMGTNPNLNSSPKHPVFEDQPELVRLAFMFSPLASAAGRVVANVMETEIPTSPYSALIKKSGEMFSATPYSSNSEKTSEELNAALMRVGSGNLLPRAFLSFLEQKLVTKGPNYSFSQNYFHSLAGYLEEATSKNMITAEHRSYIADMFRAAHKPNVFFGKFQPTPAPIGGTFYATKPPEMIFADRLKGAAEYFSDTNIKTALYYVVQTITTMQQAVSEYNALKTSFTAAEHGVYGSNNQRNVFGSKGQQFQISDRRDQQGDTDPSYKDTPYWTITEIFNTVFNGVQAVLAANEQRYMLSDESISRAIEHGYINYALLLKDDRHSGFVRSFWTDKQGPTAMEILSFAHYLNIAHTRSPQ